MNIQNETLGGFLDQWLETVIKGNVRFSTYTSYKGYTNNHIKRLIGGMALTELKPIYVQKFAHDLLDEGRLCARMVGIIIAMLGNALTYAEDYEMIVKNPCKRIKLPKAEEKEIKVFSNVEQTRIEYAVLISDDDRLYGVLITLYTGLRIGELCALKWADIDFDNKCLKVKASLNRAEQAGHGSKKTVMTAQEPKTKKSKRTIQLPEFLIGVLRKLKAGHNGEYVISMKSGKFVHPRTMQMLYKKLLAKAGVDYSGFHTLRHTFATRAAELNTDAKTVSDTLGHTSAVITINRYTHSLVEQKRKMTRGLDNYFMSKQTGAFL